MVNDNRKSEIGNREEPVVDMGPLDTAVCADGASSTSDLRSPISRSQLPMSVAQAVLDTVTDPELPFLTIRDLGILRGLRDNNGTLVVTITPTYSGCPANDIIALDIDLALTRAGLGPFRVEVVRAPAWTTDWITPEGRAKLAANGIAPPTNAGGKRALFDTEVLACPRCGSTHTEQVSAFGSTACKAHHRCLDCREPFEAFKCI